MRKCFFDDYEKDIFRNSCILKIRLNFNIRSREGAFTDFWSAGQKKQPMLSGFGQKALNIDIERNLISGTKTMSYEMFGVTIALQLIGDKMKNRNDLNSL